MTQPRRWLTAHPRATMTLLSTAVLLLTTGCVDSTEEDAREKITAHIDQVAADATKWAQHDQPSGGLPGLQDILTHIVTTVHANARELSSDVRNSDPQGTGLLGEVRVGLEATGSGWLWSQVDYPYIFCARFLVTRPPGQPRTVSAELFDCPPDALPSGWSPTTPAATPVGTPT